MSYQAFLNSGGCDGGGGGELIGFTNLNTGYGELAGVGITSASQDVFIGAAAGYSNTTGSANTLVGYSCGNNVIDALAVTALGAEALTSCTSGNDNVSIGVNSCSLLTTASNNTACGSSSLYDVVSGNNNTAVGYQSGLNAEGGSNNNTFLGAGANQLNADTFQYSQLTLIGANCHPIVQGQNNQFVLGSIETIYIPSGEIVLGDDTEDNSFSIELSGANSALEIITYSVENGTPHNTVTILDDNINFNVNNISIGSVVESGANYQLSILGESSTLNITAEGQIEINSHQIVTSNMLQSGSSTSNGSGAGSVTFTTAFSVAPSVILTPGSALNTPYIDTISTTGFTYETTGASELVYWIASS